MKKPLHAARLVKSFYFTVLSIVICNTLFAQRGIPDSSFGINGKIISSLTGESFQATSIALQTDGKIVLACKKEDYSANDFIVIRFNNNGTKDSSFGINGVVGIPFTGKYNVIANAIYVQPDDKIIVGGSLNYIDCALIRLQANGLLDNSFSADGKQIISFGNYYENITAIKMQGAKILVTGSAKNTDYDEIVLARFKPDGSPDTAFGENGTVYKSIFLTGNEHANSLTVQPDNKILVAGSADTGRLEFPYNKRLIVLLRYTKNGIPDSSFGINGIVKTNADNYDPDEYAASNATAVTVQSDTRIVIAGYAWTPIPSGGLTDFCVIRYFTNGTIDSSFGTDGISRSTQGNTIVHFANGIAVMPDGKVIASGYGGIFSYGPKKTDFLMINYKTNGVPDRSFGVKGAVNTSFNKVDVSTCMAIENGNKIILAGYTIDSVTGLSSVAIARYIYNPVVTAPPFAQYDNLIAQPSVKLYPNPVKDILRIEGITNKAKLTIADGYGKILRQAVSSGNYYSCNTSTLSAGIYYVTISSDREIINLKFVKE